VTEIKGDEVLQFSDKLRYGKKLIGADIELFQLCKISQSFRQHGQAIRPKIKGTQV
jgi:hypothetical protein